MKKNLLALILFVLSSSAFSSDVCEFASEEFFDAVDVYKKGDTSAFLKRLLKDGPLVSEVNHIEILPQLNQIEGFFGAINGASILSEKTLGSRSCYIYGVLEYDNGPAYAHLNYYETSNGYILSSFSFKTDAEDILPFELLIE